MGRKNGGRAPDEAVEEPQFVAGPLAFGRKLAHTDKVVRDRGLRILTDFLQKKGGQLARGDYLKLWKALVYCFWMSDKRLVQQELAVKLATLSRFVPQSKYAEWVGCFWESLTREWQDFDRYRMNKYLKLLRIQTAEMFSALRKQDYDLVTIEAVMAELRGPAGPLAPRSSSGVALALAGFWWEELEVELSTAAPSTPSMLALLDPFVEMLAMNAQEHVLVRIGELLGGVPAAYAKALSAKAMAVGESEEIKQPNREALYNLVESLNVSARAAKKAKKADAAEPAEVAVEPELRRKKAKKAELAEPEPASPKGKKAKKAELAEPEPASPKGKKPAVVVSPRLVATMQAPGSPLKAPGSPLKLGSPLKGPGSPGKEVWPGKSPPKSPPPSLQLEPSTPKGKKKKTSVGSKASGRSSDRRVSFSPNPPATKVFSKKRSVAPPGSPLPSPSPQKLKSCLKK